MTFDACKLNVHSVCKRVDQFGYDCECRCHRWERWMMVLLWPALIVAVLFGVHALGMRM